MKKSTKHLPRESLGDSYNSVPGKICYRMTRFAHKTQETYLCFSSFVCTLDLLGSVGSFKNLLGENLVT